MPPVLRQRVKRALLCFKVRFFERNAGAVIYLRLDVRLCVKLRFILAVWCGVVGCFLGFSLVVGQRMILVRVAPESLHRIQKNKGKDVCHNKDAYS